MMRSPVLQLALFILLSLLSLSSATTGRKSSPGRTGGSYCRHTTYPALCTSATRAFGGGVPNVEAVLKMHLGAISHRSDSATRTAMKLMRGANPVTQAALKHCGELYRAKWDMVGVSLRELHTKDPQTKQMVRIMLQLLRQSAQECDYMFQQSRIPNPLLRYNRSIFKLAINSDDLNNLMA